MNTQHGQSTKSSSNDFRINQFLVFVRTLERTYSQDFPRVPHALENSMIHEFCKSQYISQFATFVIEVGAKTSPAKGCIMSFFHSCFQGSFLVPHQEPLFALTPEQPPLHNLPLISLQRSQARRYFRRLHRITGFSDILLPTLTHPNSQVLQTSPPNHRLLRHPPSHTRLLNAFTRLTSNRSRATIPKLTLLVHDTPGL